MKRKIIYVHDCIQGLYSDDPVKHQDCLECLSEIVSSLNPTQSGKVIMINYLIII